MVNPYNSPWLTPPKPPFIQDKLLYRRWQDIAKLFTGSHTYREGEGYLIIDEQFIIAKWKTKMRLISHLDWVHYTPQALAAAMDTNTVCEYYEWQHKDPNSDPNIWLDKIKEQDLKVYYAQRIGRANQI